MITPTIGRVIYVVDRKGSCDVNYPEPALITFVHTDRSINVAGFNAQGHPFRLMAVALVQGDEKTPITGLRAEWMPYQVGVAKGTAQPVHHAVPDSVKARLSYDAQNDPALVGEPIDPAADPDELPHVPV
jgi:hypothetical protein